MLKGLFRLWLLLTVVWVALTLLVTLGEARPDVVVRIQTALIPPGAFLVVGIMLASMFAGLRDRNRPRSF